nr:unnamed protein product [Callosobruchus analis]
MHQCFWKQRWTIYPGLDKVLRSVTVRTSSGVQKTAISKICPLPVIHLEQHSIAQRGEYGEKIDNGNTVAPKGAVYCRCQFFHHTPPVELSKAALNGSLAKDISCGYMCDKEIKNGNTVAPKGTVSIHHSNVSDSSSEDDISEDELLPEGDRNYH